MARVPWKTILAVVGALTLYVAGALTLHAAGARDLLIVYLTLALMVPVGLLIAQRSGQKDKLQSLREASLRAEVQMLKNQINPHFFFNTLNHLYGLSLAQSEQAPAMILKLSDMMRYTIYEGRKDQVPLCDELDYLRHYIELNQMRFGDQLQLAFTAEVADDQVRLPPLMTVVLLENAFKHGVARLGAAGWIRMHIEADTRDIVIHVANNYDPSADQGRAGIGLANLERRLNLLYGRRDALQIARNGDEFHATLRLRTL